MKNVSILSLILACQVFSKDRIIELRKNIKDKLTPKAIADLYGKVDDEELLGEISDFERQKGKLPEGDFNTLFEYGVERELVLRGARNQKFGKKLIGSLESETTSKAVKHSILRHFWKIKREGEDVLGDEAILRRFYARNSKDKSLSKEVLKKINTTSDENIDFLSDVAEQTTDQQEILTTINALGRLSRKSIRERNTAKSVLIKERIRKLKAERKITTAVASISGVFADSEEDRAYMMTELEKEGFENWPVVLMSMKENVGFGNLKKIYEHCKQNRSVHAEEGFLSHLTRLNMARMDAPKEFQSDADKIDFLELRSLASDDPDLQRLDPVILRLLLDGNEAVRFVAVKAAHFCLRNNHAVLFNHYQSETSPSIKSYLKEYGYAE